MKIAGLYYKLFKQKSSQNHRELKLERTCFWCRAEDGRNTVQPAVLPKHPRARWPQGPRLYDGSYTAAVPLPLCAVWLGNAVCSTPELPVSSSSCLTFLPQDTRVIPYCFLDIKANVLFGCTEVPEFLHLNTALTVRVGALSWELTQSCQQWLTYGSK